MGNAHTFKTLNVYIGDIPGGCGAENNYVEMKIRYNCDMTMVGAKSLTKTIYRGSNGEASQVFDIDDKKCNDGGLAITVDMKYFDDNCNFRSSWHRFENGDGATVLEVEEGSSGNAYYAQEWTSHGVDRGIFVSVYNYN